MKAPNSVRLRTRPSTVAPTGYLSCSVSPVSYTHLDVYKRQYLDGAITNGERYNKVIEIWSGITEKVADEMFGQMQRRDKEGFINPIYVMADSGARGSKQQIRQLSGMRGLMALSLIHI